MNDHQFIHFQSSGDFFRHRHIVDDIKTKWPSPEQQPLCVEVDYLVAPPRVLVQPVWDVFWPPGYHTAETERYLRKAKQEYEQFNKRAILVCVIIRNGDLSYKYLVLLDIDHEWRLNGTTRVCVCTYISRLPTEISFTKNKFTVTTDRRL